MHPRLGHSEANLWERPWRLRGISAPRIAISWASKPPDHSIRYNFNTVIIADGMTLRSDRYRDAILDTVGAACRFDGGAWKYQRPFFTDLLGSYFSENGEDPAWIGVYLNRKTMANRQERGFAVDTLTDPVRFADPVGKLRDHRLRLPGLRIACEDLVLAPRPDIPARDTYLSYQRVGRDLRDVSAGSWQFRIWERWFYLATEEPGDRVDAAAGRIPALNQFYDHDRQVQRAPIVSLNKLGSDLSTSTCIAFGLHPFEGSTLDFRMQTTPFEFYLRSAPAVHVALKRAITPGQWEAF